jgi:hypothetical protein
MNTPHRFLGLAALSLLSITPLARAADETLWNLNFKNLKPGQALAEVPFSAPCSGPQKVSVDAQDTLAGAASVGTMTSPVLFTKTGSGHYMPAFTLKAGEAYTSGVITASFDITFDKVTPTAARPVTTLMAVPFLDKDGGSSYVVVIGADSPTDLFLAGVGFAKGAKGQAFKAGDIAHIKAVLDLNTHTFQVFLGDVPMAEPEHDDKKFASFLGLTVRDGTALGGNNGETFEAGISNLVVTHS